MSMYIRLVFDLPAGVCSEKKRKLINTKDIMFSHVLEILYELQIILLSIIFIPISQNTKEIVFSLLLEIFCDLQIL